ncbi:PREDICTED: protein arginine N-methyltransferase 2 isoform X3 [Myotis davidii]|uniref:protein arginine N-methyltransferase 2 isoform X3 n=1 Tax=Myotis davidii TaxID=225400 RepID=UPI0003EC535F|nr:PREDICTED: protein arginine N-methyltransferase 2 isoform X3 [Myotis davidii]
MATSGDCPGSESQGREEPVEHCEQHLPGGVHPEEFVAIADYSATDETQLSFLRGEKILILRQTTADWWWGERAGYCGYIPANHLGKDLEEGDPEDTWQDEEYFGSYGTLKLHLEMLTDQPRTTKYHHVILQNRASLKDKVILDVGCGTGIISLFCAHYAQPRAVYAVEASEMAQHTGQLVMQNGFADIITVFQQKVEDVVLPEKVDVLVSEWMGTCLLHHPLEAGAVYDGRARPRSRRGCAHRLDCAAEKPSVEEAHVRRSELVRHLQTGPHGAESWRKSLSDLEMTVEVLFAKQCELGGKQSEELTPMRTLLLVKPADAHSVL